MKELKSLIALCSEAFENFSEIWVIGPKGDHYKNLVDLRVIKESQIQLHHVHNQLGSSKTDRLKINPPEGSSKSFEGIFTDLNIDIIGEIDRVIAQNKQVCILMPFPNIKLNRIISQKHAERHFTVTAPVKEDATYMLLESKLGLQRLIEKASPELARRILIPSTKVVPTDSFKQITRRLQLSDGYAVYLQRDLSVGGEGTMRIQSQSELANLLTDVTWKESADHGLLKASMEIRDAYPANGSACIVPTGDNTCEVYIDPLSHKPTNVAEIGMKENCGIGNDWSNVWPENIQMQYIEATTLIGKELYKRWGYTGFFGPDYLVENTKDGCQLRITEINPRWQGTTPYQTYNALIAQRLPLELIHYALKLDKNGKLSKQVIGLLGDADLYNRLSVASAGCFYIKVGSPKIPQKVEEDLNGSWWFDGEEMHSKGPFTYKHLTKYSPHSLPVMIKSPPVGTPIPEGFMAIAYIVGRSSVPIFSTTTPEVSEYGLKLFRTVKNRLFSEVTT